MSIRWTMVLSFGLATSAADAIAATPPPALHAAADPWQRHSLQMSLGVGSPIGFIGIVYGTPALDRLSLQAGVGLGSSGLLLSAMPKLALYKGEACRIGFGIGPGMGIAALSGENEPGPVSAWLDADIFNVECRNARGGVFSFGVGFTARLSERIPSNDDGYPDLDNGGPQLHFGFGPTF